MLMVSGRRRVPNPPAIKIALRIPESLKSDISENVSKLVRIVVAKYAFAPNRKAEREAKESIFTETFNVKVVKLSIIIPAYNEAPTLATLVERVCLVALPLEKELIVIDDASTDGTAGIALELLREKKIQHLHRLATNQGKGRAVREGLRFASGDILLIQDADLEYAPSDYGNMLAPILNQEADVVFGSRFKSNARSGEKHGAYFFNTLANHTLTFLSNQVSGLNLSDIAACYKAFRREVLSQFTIEEARFGIDAELVMKCAKLAREKDVQLAEVEIGYRPRSFEEGKKIRWRDGLSVLRAIWKYR